jgi:hypothetical protein
MQPLCRCGHPEAVHEGVISVRNGREGCYGLEALPKGKRPTWDDRLCGCPGYRAAWPRITGKAECVECGLSFTWRGRERIFCSNCERSCPNCRAYCRGGTHCPNCGRWRGLSSEEFAADAPPLSMSQRVKLEGCSISITSRANPIGASPGRRCIDCGEVIPHAQPAICDDCFVKRCGHPRGQKGLRAT